MTQDPRRCATLFCRVSSAKQANNFSTDSQERLGREYAARQGLTVTKVFRIVETASKKAERKQWAEYLDYARRGPELHALVATVDRATRNFHDQAEVAALNEKWGKVVHFFADGIVLDGKNRSETTVRYGVMGTFAAYFAAQLAEKTRRGIDQKALKGEWPNKAPFGYLNDKATKRLVVDPAKARWVRRIKALAAEGRSLDFIVEALYEEGCRPYGERIHRNLVERTIRSPLYTGRYDWPPKSGNWVQGVHEPIVTWDEHVAAVAGLERKHRPRYRRHSFVFSGLLTCGCCPEGRAVVFEVKKGKFVYAHCTGTRRVTRDGARVKMCPDAQFVPLAELERQAVAMLETIRVTEQQAADLLKDLAADAGTGQAATEAELAVIQGQLTKLAQRQARAYADKLDGKIEETFWAEQQRLWGAEKVALEERARRLREVGPSTVLPNVRKVLELAKEAAGLYKFLNDDEKRELLKTICSNYQLTGKNLAYTMEKPFALVAEGLSFGNWLRD